MMKFCTGCEVEYNDVLRSLECPHDILPNPDVPKTAPSSQALEMDYRA